MSEFLKPICPRCYQPMSPKGWSNDQNTPRRRYQCKNELCTMDRTVNPLEGADKEVLATNVRLAKQKQQHMDTNRIERKSFREHARVENAYAEYTKELIEVVKANPFNCSPSLDVSNAPAAGVIQLSDLHFNELVDLPHNQYSFEMASRRLKRFAQQSIKLLHANNVGNVLIACTGDLMNSDRRMDELLSNATNRSKATFLAADILSQFIGEIQSHFNTSVASITGNEGRVDKEPGWNEAIATHNYDWTIHNILKLRFAGTDVNFIDGDPLELVVEVGGLNILLLHGHSITSKTSLSDLISKLIGKWSARGVRIDYAIFGHIHESAIGDIYSRSGSTVGANAYSEHGLNLISRASQNVYVVDELKNINGFKIDLQNPSDDMYEIDTKLAQYNAKSSGKLDHKHVIHQIVI